MFFPNIRDTTFASRQKLLKAVALFVASNINMHVLITIRARWLVLPKKLKIST